MDSLNDLPYEDLVALDFRTMNDDQIRLAIKVHQEQATNPAARKAKVAKDAARVSGRRPKNQLTINADSLLDL